MGSLATSLSRDFFLWRRLPRRIPPFSASSSTAKEKNKYSHHVCQAKLLACVLALAYNENCSHHVGHTHVLACALASAKNEEPHSIVHVDSLSAERLVWSRLRRHCFAATTATHTSTPHHTAPQASSTPQRRWASSTTPAPGGSPTTRGTGATLSAWRSRRAGGLPPPGTRPALRGYTSGTPLPGQVGDDAVEQGRQEG